MCGCFSTIDPDAAGVIEVDVGDEDLAHVAETDALLLERRRQVPQRRRRPGVDEGDAGRPVEDRRRDDLGTAEKVEVDVIES